MFRLTMPKIRAYACLNTLLGFNRRRAYERRY